MTCCSELKLCHETDGQLKVLVDDGGLSVFDINGQPWAGDASLVAPCGDLLPPDLCSSIGGADTVDCAAADSLVADCGTVPTDDLIPGHTRNECLGVPELLQPTAGGGGGAGVSTLQSTELERGQYGNIVYHGGGDCNPVPNGTIPLTLNVPAANPDCVLALHVAFGGFEDPNSGQWGSAWTGGSLSLSGSDVSAPTLMHSIYPTAGGAGGQPDGIGQLVWFFDPLTGATGSTVTLDFLTTGEGNPWCSVLQYYWVEICDGAGATPISVADFDAGAAVEQTMASSSTSPSVDMGDCPSTYFATGRHVSANNTAGENVDTDWFGSSIMGSGMTETYDTTAYDQDWYCQTGAAHGVIDGGSGSFTWSHTSNTFGGVAAGHATAVFIPLADCQNLGGGTTTPDDSAQCDVSLTNDNCRQDSVARCWARTSVTICNAAGETTQLVPVFNGVELMDQAVGSDVEGCVTLPVSFEITDLSTVVAPGGVATHSLSWRASGSGEASLSDWILECELIHL